MKFLLFLALLVAVASCAEDARDKRQLLLGSTWASPLIAPGIIGSSVIADPIIGARIASPLAAPLVW
ncbi:hypothetical protein O3M35_000843 [Rhynocoris fuscipes]|uniref:Uncharacterized protein n=1 Tax=Rhynocoris fuscipes TaxID=488301 RepID=A0AAW1DQV3_9HEMI